MESIHSIETMESYELPFHQSAKLNKANSILFVVCSIICAMIAGFFLIIVSKDEPKLGFLSGLFMLVLSVFFAFGIIINNKNKNGYIKITRDYIKYSTPFKVHIAYWNEIHEINVFEFNNNAAFGILLKKDIAKKKERTLSNSLNNLYGYPTSSIQISLLLFKEIDAEKLLLTMQKQLDQVSGTCDYSVSEMIDESIDNGKNIFKAILWSFLITIFISLIYGFTIYKFETNFIAIPIFTSIFIIAVFNKYYVEEHFSLGIRLFLGILCLIQTPIAFIEHIMLTAKVEVTFNNLVDVTIEFFIYVMDNPLEQIFMIIGVAICFGIGILRGRTGKELNN